MYGKIISEIGANLRATPNGRIIIGLNCGERVEVHGARYEGGYEWLHVKALSNSYWGFVAAEFVLLDKPHEKRKLPHAPAHAHQPEHKAPEHKHPEPHPQASKPKAKPDHDKIKALLWLLVCVGLAAVVGLLLVYSR